MGAFDFIKDAGAKIGIGESTAESAAKEVASQATKKAAADAARKASEDTARAKLEAEGKARIEAARQKREAAQAAEDAPAQEATKERRQRHKKRVAKMGERRAEARKSRELEKYVRDLGLHAENLDIRFDDGTAFVEGTVAAQADKERIILAVGNVAGVSKVDEEIEVVAAEPEAKMYTVVKGDTLSKIAQEFYGDPMKYPTIFEANQPMLKDADLIYPGQVLRIPAL